jgi:hypothetical protein
MGWLSKRRVRKEVVKAVAEFEVFLETAAVVEEHKDKYLYPQNEGTTDQQATINMMVVAAMQGTASDLESDKAFRALMSRLSEEQMKHAQAIAMRRCQEWIAELQRANTEDS